jgi:sec-independent protein translocase protein TatA
MLFGKIGPYEMAIVLFIAILIFGPKQLPKLGRLMGETLQSFKGAGKELRDLHNADFDDEDGPKDEKRTRA